MKLYLTTLFILAGIATGNSQQFAYGITAGTNFTRGGQVTGISHKENGELVYWTGTSQAESKAGFHGGAFVEVTYGDFFLRPEMVYTNLQSEYIFPNKSTVYTVQKFDVPLLVGYKFGQNFGLYAGPVYSPIFKNEFQDKEFTIIKEEQGNVFIPGSSLSDPTTPINFQLGMKTEFLGVGFDLRYEHNLSSPNPEKIDILNNQNYREEGGVNIAMVDDARLSQIILSLTYNFSELVPSPDRRSRGRGSYSRRRRTR